MSIYQDRSGLLWLGTRSAGVSTWHPRSWRLGHQQPAWAEDAPLSSFASIGETLYVGTAGAGLKQLNPSAERHFGVDEGLSDPRVMALWADAERLWIGTMGAGLAYLDHSAGNRATVRTPDNLPSPLKQAGVTVLHGDQADRLWVGTFRDGLWAINPHTLEPLPLAGQEGGALKDRQILSLAKAKGPSIWVGTNAGLLRFHPQQGITAELTHDPDDPASLPAATVYALHRDDQGQLWVGTSDGGLGRLLFEEQEPDAYRFSALSPAQLGANAIYGISSRRMGAQGASSDGSPQAGVELWLATNNGLLAVDPLTEAVRRYTPEQGAQGYEYNFGAHHRTAAGELVFGGARGFNHFDPASLAEQSAGAPLVLTEFEARGGSLSLCQRRPTSPSALISTTCRAPLPCASPCWT